MPQKTFARSPRNKIKSLTALSLAVAIAVGVQPIAAHAVTVGSAVGFSSISLDYRSAYVSTGVNQYNSSRPESTYQWYKCSTKTDFIAMVPAPTSFEGALVVVNSEAVIQEKLTEAGCVAIAGEFNETTSITNLYNSNGTLKDPSKPFVSVTTIVTPPSTISQLPHTAIATGAYLRTATNPVPGMKRVGDEYVSTDPTFNNGTGDFVITPTRFSWYACDQAVVSGSKLHEWIATGMNVSDTPVATCQKLFTSWFQEEGWGSTEISGLRFDPAAGPVYTNSPDSPYEPYLVNDVPAAIDLDGKYLVRTIDAYPYFGWSNGVKVGAEVVEEEAGSGNEESELGSENLADTGYSPEIQLSIALMALLSGMGLVLISRRRRNV